MSSIAWPDHPSPRPDRNPGANLVVARGKSEEWAHWWRLQALACRHGDPVERLAARQGFVLTRAHARACGLTDAAIRRRVRRGVWWVPRRGVLAVVAIPEPTTGDYSSIKLAERRRLALACTAAARAKPGQTISGNCAAVLYGLALWRDPVEPQLTTAPALRASPVTPSITQGRRAAALVRAATLRPAEIDAWFGAPITTRARTLVDLARHSRRDGLIAADAALHEGLVRSADIDRALVLARGWPGVRRARRVLARASPLAESPLETLTRLRLHDSGLPMPELQVEIDAFGTVYRVDMMWPAQRVVLEADGRLKHTGDELWREKVRQERLARLGYTVLRVMWSDVRDEWPATAARIARALAQTPPAFSSV